MIDEVILGPKVKNPTEAANYAYFGYKNILVSKSRIKYRFIGEVIYFLILN